MKLVRVISIAVLGLSLSGAPALAGPRHNINRREARQQHRIAQGIRDGSLTPKETARLERQEARINVLEAKARKSDGLNPEERGELNRLLNLESHRIYVQKHDGQGK
jgi:hypothetical protein